MIILGSLLGVFPHTYFFSSKASLLLCFQLEPLPPYLYVPVLICMTDLPPAPPAHPSILTHLQRCSPHLLVGQETRGESITVCFVSLCFQYSFRVQTPFVTCQATHYAASPHRTAHDSSSQWAGGSLQCSKPSCTSHLHQHVGYLLSRGGNGNKE